MLQARAGASKGRGDEDGSLKVAATGGPVKKDVKSERSHGRRALIVVWAVMVLFAMAVVRNKYATKMDDLQTYDQATEVNGGMEQPQRGDMEQASQEEEESEEETSEEEETSAQDSPQDSVDDDSSEFEETSTGSQAQAETLSAADLEDWEDPVVRGFNPVRVEKKRKDLYKHYLSLVEKAEPAAAPEYALETDVVFDNEKFPACWNNDRYVHASGEIMRWFSNTKRPLLPYPSYAEMAPKCSLMQVQKFSLAPVKEGRLHMTIGLQTCASGGKTVQVACKRETARAHGCEDYESYGLQPRTFDLAYKKECMAFMELSKYWAKQPVSAKQWWLLKPAATELSHGVGQKLLDSNGVMNYITSYSAEPCAKPSNFQVQHYIMNPLLIKGFKFDIRTYALVARADPFMIFYADAFSRISMNKFSLNTTDVRVHITNSFAQSKDGDHFSNYSHTQDLLDAEGKVEQGFMHGRFRNRAILITKYLFRAFREHPTIKGKDLKRRYNFYGLDWVIDEYGNIQLLEANAKCDQTNPAMGPGFYQEAMRLNLMIHATPRLLIKKSWDELTVARNYTFGRFALIWSELEQKLSGQEEQPVCDLLDSIRATWVGPTPQFSIPASAKRDQEQAASADVLATQTGQPQAEAPTHLRR